MTKTSGSSDNDLKALHEALTAQGERLYTLLHHHDPDILKALLRNPRISDDQLLIVLMRRDLTEDLVTAIYKRTENNRSHRILLAIARNPAVSGPIIRNILPYLRLFELLDICLLPGGSPDQKLAAERVILQRIPTAPLGHKMTLARRGTATIATALLKEGNGQIVDVCLSNPRLNEAAVFQFLRGGSAKAETISMVARHERWKQRPNIQTAILKNAKTPDIWFTLWLPKLSRPLFLQLEQSLKNHPGKKRLIQAEKQRRGLGK